MNCRLVFAGAGPGCGDRRRLELQAELLAEGARGIDALIDGLGHPIARVVEEVVDRHFRFDQPERDGAAELTLAARRDLVVALLDAIPHREEVRVGDRLDDVEVLRDEARAPFVARLTVQIAQISSAPRLIASSTFASVM